MVVVYLVPSPALPCLESLHARPEFSTRPPSLLHNPFHRPRTWRCDRLQLATITIFPDHCFFALVIDDLHLLSTTPLFSKRPALLRPAILPPPPCAANFSLPHSLSPSAGSRCKLVCPTGDIFAQIPPRACRRHSSDRKSD